MSNILPGPGSIPTIGRVPVDRANIFQLAAALDVLYGGRSMAAVVLMTHNYELGELIRAARLTLHESGVHEIPTSPVGTQDTTPPVSTPNSEV
jgi:hypothetical protein